MGSEERHCNPRTTSRISRISGFGGLRNASTTRLTHDAYVCMCRPSRRASLRAVFREGLRFPVAGEAQCVKKRISLVMNIDVSAPDRIFAATRAAIEAAGARNGWPVELIHERTLDPEDLDEALRNWFRFRLPRLLDDELGVGVEGLSAEAAAGPLARSAAAGKPQICRYRAGRWCPPRGPLAGQDPRPVASPLGSLQSRTPTATRSRCHRLISKAEQPLVGTFAVPLAGRERGVVPAKLGWSVQAGCASSQRSTSSACPSGGKTG